MAAATTGLLIAAGIAGASQIAAAKIGSNAANKAGEIQAGSATDAKGELRPIYDASVARMQPYAALGGQALGQLGALSGFPAIPAGGASTGPLGPLNGQQGPMNMSDPRVQNLAQGGSLVDPGMSGLGSLGANPVTGAGTGGGMSSYGPPAGTGGSFGPPMVTLTAPTGETGQFPADQAEFYISRGAKRVG